MGQPVTVTQFFGSEEVKKLGVALALRVWHRQGRLGETFWDSLAESQAHEIYQIGVAQGVAAIHDNALKRLLQIAAGVGTAYVIERLAAWRRIVKLPYHLGVEIQRQVLCEIRDLLKRQGKEAYFSDWQLVAERDRVSTFKRDILQGKLATAKCFRDWESIATEFRLRPRAPAFQKAIGKMFSLARTVRTNDSLAIDYWVRIVKISTEGSKHRRQALTQLKRLAKSEVQRSLITSQLSPGGVAIDAEVKRLLSEFAADEAKKYFNRAMRIRLPDETDLALAFNRADHLRDKDRRRLEDKTIDLFRTVEEVH